MTQLSKLEAKIRTLVPSLQELSFGCVVVYENVHFILTGKPYDENPLRWAPAKAIADAESEQGNEVYIKDCEIIGHPIYANAVLPNIEPFHCERLSLITHKTARLATSGMWSAVLRLPY
jgi:hypothetical protein